MQKGGQQKRLQRSKSKEPRNGAAGRAELDNYDLISTALLNSIDKTLYH